MPKSECSRSARSPPRSGAGLRPEFGSWCLAIKRIFRTCLLNGFAVGNQAACGFVHVCEPTPPLDGYLLIIRAELTAQRPLMRVKISVNSDLCLI